MDIFFLLDSSESAKLNFEQEKQFAVDTVNGLQGAQLQTGYKLSLRAALLQYSSHVKTEQTFNDWNGSEKFRTQIGPIDAIGHGTYTTYAITNMTKIYKEDSNSDVIRVALLLTDFEYSPNNPDIFSAVTEAKNQGIKFIMLGITRRANESTKAAQLRRLASSSASTASLYPHNLQDEDVTKKIVTEIVSIH